MSTTTNFQKHVVLTQAQYNARKAAGTLVAGTIYDISDYTPPVFPTLNQGAGININTSGDTKTFSVNFAVNDGLKTDGNDQLTVDYTQVQHKLTAGSNITISGNTISATGGGGSYTAGGGISISGSAISAKCDNDTMAVDSGGDLNVLKVPGYIWFEPDGEDLKFDGSQGIDILAGSNVTFTKNGNTLTISATGGGTSAHLYRHDIKLKDSDTHGHEIYFTLYSSQATSMTYAQLLAALPANGFEMPAGGFDISDDLIYTSICAYDGCICATAYSAGEIVEDDYEADYTTITDQIKIIF